MRAIALATLALFFAVLPAQAVVFTVHDDASRACYLQTLAEPTAANDKQGLEICSRALEGLNNDDYNRAATYVNRADIRLRIQDFLGVVADCDAAIALQPDVAAAHLNRGAGLYGLQRYREAVVELDKAIALKAGKLELAYFNRGLARESLGDLLGAYHDYKSAVDIDPKFTRANEELSRFRVTSTANGIRTNTP